MCSRNIALKGRTINWLQVNLYLVSFFFLAGGGVVLVIQPRASHMAKQVPYRQVTPTPEPKPVFPFYFGSTGIELTAQLGPSL
jgi:hypothetical protein